MTAGGRVITPGYNLLSELLSLQKTPYVILLAQSTGNITFFISWESPAYFPMIQKPSGQDHTAAVR